MSKSFFGLVQPHWIVPINEQKYPGYFVSVKTGRVYSTRRPGNMAPIEVTHDGRYFLGASNVRRNVSRGELKEVARKYVSENALDESFSQLLAR